MGWPLSRWAHSRWRPPVILQGEWQIIAGQLRRRRREGGRYVLSLMDTLAAVKIAAIQDKIATVAAR